MKIARRALRLACAIALPLAALIVVLPLAEAQIEPVTWTRLSSSTGDLPIPPVSDGQSGLRVVDLDQNGQNDYVITLWSAAETVIWYRHLGDTFEKYVIDTETPNLSHGEKFKDIDGDGDIDLLFGDAALGNNIYWWENPYPDYDPDTPWIRRIIRDTGGNFYHDNIWGDFDDDGVDELIAWNQKGLQLLLFEIPADPKNSGPWPVTQIFSWTGFSLKYRGADAADIDLDGKIDFVGGGGWFEHTGGVNFTFHPIDGAMGYSQIKAGQLISGGRPEVVCILELSAGPLNMYEWTGSEWQTRTLLSNVPRSHTLQIGDVNSDGYLDIMTGEMGQWSAVGAPPDNPDAKISVLYGDGNGNFTQQVVSLGQGVLEGQLVDIDSDGDLDIVANPHRHNSPRVDIWINHGFTSSVEVPDVVGVSQSAAEMGIIAAGLSVGTVSTVYSDTIPVGEVIGQEPVAGFTVISGWEVDLVVSLGEGAYQQDFEGFANNADPENWLDTGANNSLVEDDSLFKVFDLSGEKAFGTTSTQTNIHSHYAGPGVNPDFDYEYSGRMMITEPGGGIGVTFLSQYPSLDAYYRLRRYGNNSFHISSHGTSVSGEIDTGVFPIPNQWYRFRIQVEDTVTRTEIRARVWLDGESEPPFWRVDAYDDNPTRLIAGTIGVWGFQTGGKFWDNLVVGSLGEPPVMVDVPDVVGFSQADAEVNIVAAGLSVGTITTANSDTVPAGDVISQDPIAGTAVPSGSTVDLVISLGPLEMVDVPDVVGISQLDAETAIAVAGLSMGTITTANSDTVPAGDVISQDPVAGTAVPSGSAVDIVVSLGPLEMVDVPDVVGSSQSDAELAIAVAGLSVGTITTANSDTVPAGDVISQDPIAGTAVPSGSAVDLVVSLGPLEMVDVPDVVGISQTDAEVAIVAAGLSVGTITTANSDTVPAGDVISQDPVAGTAVLSGSAVDIVVSLGTAAYQQNFEGYADGEDPLDWLDTDANNSLLANDTLFEVFDLSGEKAFGTPSAAINIHSHYVGGSIDALSGYEYSGRMMIAASGGGIGVTFFSDFPLADAYYRLRRYASNPAFHLASHGTSVSGDKDTGVIPVANVWYQFRIQVEDTGTQTEIRAKVWADGETEPVDWQAQANDVSPTRLTAGTIGLWSMGSGNKYWDDLTAYALGSPPEMVDVPDVVGSSQADAEAAIVAAGLSVGAVTTANSDTVPAGDVISQDPVAGASVPIGSTVDLVVSLGLLEMLDVPDVVGISQTDAEAAIAAAGLNVGTITTAYSDTAPEGEVISQNPLAGVSVPSGSAVDIHVSLGPLEMVDVPDVVGSSQADAEADIVAAGLSVGAVTTASSDTVPEGDIISQDPVAGTAVPSGSVVDIVVSSGTAAYQQDFEGYAAGEDPADWLDTGANSSLLANDSLFTVFDLNGEKAFGTPSTATNIHSHYVGGSIDALSGYEYSGRMMIAASGGGIGVTFFSDYPLADAYYRLRRYASNPAFHLASHGTSVSGDKDTGVIPVANVWYQFRIQVEDTGTQTEIRAKVWSENDSEPVDWLIDAFDDSPNRLAAGTIGLWSMGIGVKYWDDLTAYTLGSPPEMVDVPDVVGFSQANAEAAIAAAGLSVGTVTTAYSDTVPAGDVISQDPVAGTTVTSGSAVDLVVSLGPLEMVDVPDVVGIPQADAETAIIAAGLSVGTVSTANSDTVPAGDVISQNPVAGTSVPNGSAVDLVVALGDFWWDPVWNYRLPVRVNVGAYERLDKPAEVAVNFSELFISIGETGVFDTNSLRVLEVDDIGQLINPAVPFQFDPAPNFDAGTNAAGDIIFLLESSTAPNTNRYFHIYFDVVGGGFSPAVVSDHVTVTDNVFDEGQNAIQVDTPAGTYFYQKEGAGFSSLVDTDGNDWIDHNPTAGSAGLFRGIPNLAYPEGHFHPGATSSATTLIGQGPLKATIHSITTDGLWEGTWEIYPRYAKFTVLKADHAYWFLYEGTPGGSLEPASDFVVRSDGTQTPLPATWTLDLANDEWVYFSDPLAGSAGRSLFLAKHEDDSVIDSYRQQAGLMTVFGFGRDGLNSLINQVPGYFTIGLMDDTDFASASTTVFSAYKDLSVVLDPIQSQAPTPPTIVTQPADQPVSVGQTATFSVTAAGSGTLTYQWQRDMLDISGATASSYTTPAVTLADDGAFFRCVVTNAAGTTTSNEALLTVSPPPPPPTIDSQPVGQTVDEGQTATFSVTASGSGTLTYQWQRDMLDISGATASSYTTPAVTLADDGALFRCVVTNAGGSTTSSEALLTVSPAPPTIVTQPVDQTVSEGQTATFSVTASGALTYQWQRDMLDISGATASSYTILAVTLADDGALFRCVVTNAQGSTTSNEAQLTVLPPSLRVTDGQVVLYGFQEGAGVTVEDVSLVAPALNLTIQDGDAVSWLPNGGLAINAPTLITSVSAATKVIDAVKASGEISVEAWVTPANTGQDGPARIVTLSQDGTNRNFTLGQGQWGSLPPAVYDMRLRTTATSLNGTPSLTTPAGGIAADLTHVVYTRDATGQARLYVDGVEQVSGTVFGDVSNWNDGYALALGNEISGGRPWLGDYHLVAIFNRALSQAEVQQNFDAGPYLQPLISDDFNSCELNPFLWTFLNPLDAGGYAISDGGSGEAFLQLSVPDGVEYNPSGAGGANESLRVMQSAADEDFEIEVKFKSIPSSDFHTEGIVIEQDAQNWLRFDVFHTSGQLYAFAGSTIGGSTNTFFDTAVPMGLEVYLLVSRVGDQWTFWYSGDGTSWVQLGLYSEPLIVSQVGVFAANPVVASEFTAEVDYFFNTATPISPEDGDQITLTVNTVGNGTVSKSPDQPSYLCDDEVLLTATPDPDWEFIGWSGALTGSNYSATITMDRDKGVTATFATLSPTITIWYGLNQSFGQHGQPQRWVNILGNVTDPDGVSSLTYSLNGVAPVTLRLGSDGRRLELGGDFNVDLDIDDLLPGANTLELRATDGLGNVTIEFVTVDYQPDTVWPQPYSIDWSALATPADIQNFAQVVDGKWKLENGNVRTAEPGYDRLIAIGDMTWGDCEITVPITLHSTPGSYGVGVLLRWSGHTDDPVVTSNPKSGWLPLGAILWYWSGRLEIYGNNGTILDTQSRTLSIGTTYWFKARVETVPGVGGFYSLKVWENGQPEPTAWDVTGQEALTDPQTGSMTLITHRADASFGNVLIQPID